MNSQNIIIYNNRYMYSILKELDRELGINVIELKNEVALLKEIKYLSNYLIITKKKLPNIKNQYVIEKTPIKIFKLMEYINVEILKNQFSDQLKVNVKDYSININSRELEFKNKKLKLTEKEVQIIIYLLEKKTPVNVKELQGNVWGYQFDIETHTVETHIYRLRKKIFEFFDDESFIISNKNGYQIF